MDDPETFSVGVHLASQRLSVENLTPVTEQCDEGWEPATAKEMRPRMRSGVPGENGASLHVHLRDEDVTRASSNILAAVALLRTPETRRVLESDPDSEAEVDAIHYLPGRGRAKMIVISREAVKALSSLANSSLDIDRYDLEGGRLMDLMQPVIAPYSRYRYRSMALLELHGERGERAPVVTRRTRGEYPQPFETELAEKLRTWQGSGHSFAVARASCRIRQTVYYPGNQGIGMTIGSDFIRLLASLDSDLVLDVRMRFAIRLGGHFRRWRR